MLELGTDNDQYPSVVDGGRPNSANRMDHTLNQKATGSLPSLVTSSNAERPPLTSRTVDSYQGLESLLRYNQLEVVMQKEVMRWHNGKF